MYSCEKPDKNGTIPQVVIKNFQILGFEDLAIETSLENISSTNQDELGICWSDSGIPTISDNIKLFVNKQQKDTVRAIGQNKRFYVRAFYKSKTLKENEVLYSQPIEVSTKGLKKLMEKEVSLRNFVNVVDIKLTDRNTFIVLYQCFENASLWSTYPAMIEIDENGQVLWKKEYITENSIKSPLAILDIPSGYLVFCRYIHTIDEVLVMKMDKQGNKLFERRINETYMQRLKNVDLQSDGTIKLIMSQFDSFLSDGTLINHKIVEFSLNESVEVLHREFFSYESHRPEGSDDMSNLILEFSNGNYFSANTFLNTKEFVISPKVLFQLHDKNHKLIWEKLMQEPIEAVPIKISQAINGNPIVMSPRELQRRLWLKEIDLTDGSLRWEYIYRNFRFGSSTNTYPISLYTDRMGFHYAAGDVTPYYGTQSNTFIVKIDNDGKKIWDIDFAEEPPYKYSKAQHILINNLGHIVLFRYKMQELSDTQIPFVISRYEET